MRNNWYIRKFLAHNTAKDQLYSIGTVELHISLQASAQHLLEYGCYVQKTEKCQKLALPQFTFMKINRKN